MSKILTHALSMEVGGGITYYAVCSGLIPKCCSKCGKNKTNCQCSKMKCDNFSTPVNAICILKPDNNSGVSGTVTFSQSKKNETNIHADVQGLKPGLHGFHVHEYGDLRQGCQTAKAHYNPFTKNHGAPKDEDRHVGDLGNVTADKNGNATFDGTDSQIQLCGPTSIIGRAIVVHADPDDYGKGGFPDSLTTGHAGARLACGVIGLAEKLWKTKKEK